VAHDQVDFFAMAQAVWLQRKVIALSMMLFGVAAGLYAFLVTPEYKVSTFLRPAAQNDLDALNRSEIYALPPDRALVRVGASLDSYDTRRKFFLSNQELFKDFGVPGQSLEQRFDDFNESLKLIQPDPKKPGQLSAFIGLEMRYFRGVPGPEVLNGLVAFAIDQERVQISKDLKVIIGNRLAEMDAKIKAVRAVYDADKEGKIAVLQEADNLKRSELQDELKALKVKLKVLRDDRIAQLDEAINVARALGLKKPSTPSTLADQSLASSNVMRTEINNQQLPLYFLGTEVLESERNTLARRVSDDFSDSRIAEIRKELLLLGNNRKIEMLNSRTNDDLFLGGLEALRMERMRLQGVNTDISQINIVNVDRAASTPLKPIGPKKLLIVALALLLGAVFGVILVLVRNALLLRHVAGANQMPVALAPVIDVESRGEITGPQ